MHLKKQKNKLIKNFGYSIYDYNSLKKIISNYRPDLIQCPYNIIDRRIENPKIMDLLKKEKLNSSKIYFSSRNTIED